MPWRWPPRFPPSCAASAPPSPWRPPGAKSRRDPRGAQDRLPAPAPRPFGGRPGRVGGSGVAAPRGGRPARRVLALAQGIRVHQCSGGRARARGGQVRGGEPRSRPACRRAAPGGRGLPQRGGPQLFPPRGRGPFGGGPGRRAQPAGGGVRPPARGGIHHHPAGGQESRRGQRGVAAPQGPRGPGRPADGQGAWQGAGPGALPQRDTPGRGRIRRGGGC